MVLYILLGLIVAVCLWLMLRGALVANPRRLAAAVKWSLVVGLAAVAGFLLFRGNLPATLGTLGAIIPLFIRWAPLLRWTAAIFRRRPAGAPSDQPPAEPMSRERAQEILEVPEGATAEEIREAYRRRIMANHPERGGSPWRIAEIDKARDRLLEDA